jgi:hypothetical protein
MSTTEELLWRKCSGSGLEIQEYGRRDLSRWPHDKLYPQKLALTSLTSGGCSVSVVRSWTNATEFLFNVVKLEDSMFNNMLYHVDNSFMIPYLL